MAGCSRAGRDKGGNMSKPFAFSLRMAIVAAAAAAAATSIVAVTAARAVSKKMNASPILLAQMKPGPTMPAQGAGHPAMGGAMGGMGKMAPKGPKFEPATVCKQCHEEIYRDWSQSMHAHAREAWYFSHKVGSERMGMTCNNEHNVAVPCQTCHEPAGVYPLGAVMQGKPPAIAATEGVTCDVCHRITAVKGTGNFTFGPKGTKRGPYKDAKSPYHKTAYAPLITKSEFCVACHGQLQNLNRLVVCDTVRTWRESRYAREGKTCQSCHMPGVTGAAAAGKAVPANTPKNRPLRRHLFRGPHNDPALLSEAATLKQTVAKSGDGSLDIRVTVTNSGTGHDLPSGLPDRLITLKVEAKDQAGKLIWQNWRDDPYREDRQAAFGLFGFNPKGGPVPPMGASRLDRLNLLPDETRTLTYRLPPDAARKAATVEAHLTYHTARRENAEYFGTWGLAGLEPKPMANVVTPVR
jgi:hypothetical protein